MLIIQKKRWFRGCAVLTSAVTLWFAGEGATYAQTVRQAREQAQRLDDVAQRLGFDPIRVKGGEAFETGERSRIAQRRAEALARLGKLTAPPAAATAAAEQKAREIRAAHLPHLLAGAAQTAEEARKQSHRLGAARTPEEKSAAKRALETAGVSLKRSLDTAEGQEDRPRSARLAAAMSKARQLAQAAGKGARSGNTGEVERAAPPPRRGIDLRSRRPVLSEPLSPPQPRFGLRLGMELPEDLRDFYAQVLDAPGLEVETSLGLADPALLAAGFLPGARVASLGDMRELLSLAEGALAPPQPEDLAATPDTRVTPAMQQAVTAANGDVLTLYNLVHDQFEAEPYYGSKKGSAGAWEERSGNDADLSSLLIALLRAAGIPARYEYGTVELTPEQAMAWTGTTDPGFASDVLYSTGIPATKISDGSRVVAVRVEHAWVRAYVPYTNYRGVSRTGSRSIWVRLDPTLKRAHFRPAIDLRGKVAFDYDGFFSTVSGTTPLEIFEEQLRTYTAASGLPCKTLDDAIPAREVVPDELSLLPAELPARLVTSLATFAGLPAAMRHTASIGIGDWSVLLNLPEIYGSALTVRYRGASSADAAAIAAAGGIGKLSTPSAVQIVPTLTIDGVEMGRGAAVLPGLDQALNVTINIPHGGSSLVRHLVAAGSVFAVGFPVGTVPDSVVAAREAELQQAKTSGVSGDDLEAARGNRALWRYFWHLDREEPRIFALQWMRLGRDVSEGIAGRELSADLLYGTPVRVKPGDFTIDVPRYSLRPYAVDGDSSLTKAIAELSGYHGSTREHLIWEETVNMPAISTVRIFQVTRQQGLQLLSIDSSNAGLVGSLPYSEEARADITNAVHAGLVARVPERPVSWGSYLNAEGYVLEDPATGAADFRIQGTFNGAKDKGESPPPEVAGGKCPCEAPAASSVTLTMGNMHFTETDLTLPARGIPVAFTRRYDSLSPYGGRLGPGWQHSYEVRLVADPGDALVLVNDAFRAERFQRNADGSYTAPAGYHEKLEALAEGWKLTFKDGVEYRFRADGQLGAIQDLNGHAVTLQYDGSGRLNTVTDATGRVALTFGYEAVGLLSSVTDVTGRAVSFGHTGGDLTSATDVLGYTESYGYDSSHRLTSKTDKNGNTIHELYDGEGRWIGSEEPDGLGRSVSYDMLNRRAVHTDKRGSRTIYEYDQAGNPTAVTDALGNRQVMEWDSQHNKLSETDARGNQTVMTYDGAGNMLARRDAAGANTTYSYNDRGQVLTVTDDAGKTSTNSYFPNGNLQSSQDATGAETTYGYTGDGLPQTITQPGSATTTIAYQADGSVQSITDATSGTTTLGYDGYGHLSSIQDANSHTRTLEADAAGRIRSMSDAAGKKTSFEYDPQGNRTAVVDPDGKRTVFGYDALSRLTSVTDAKGNVTQTEYDAEGNVTARTDALGRKTRYTYDAAGRLIETTDAAGNTFTQGYCADVSGQACGIVDALGNLTQVSFDVLGRPTVTVDASGVTTSQHYDQLGRRDWSQDGAGRKTSYGYDDAGRLLTVTDPLNGITGYGYDARGNRTSVTDANGKVTSFTYDLANRLKTETNPLAITTSYEYDAAGNRRFKTDGNGQRTEYQYDENRRLKKMLFSDGAAYDFDYDARGNRTLEKSPTHERGLFYDELGRLTRVEDRTLGRTIQYSYDALGNRSSMQVDTGETVQYRWDAIGRLAEVTDAQGQATRYSYDAAGRRSRVTYGNGTSATYGYDAVGQVLSLVYLNATGEVQTAFGYRYDTAGNRQYKKFADGTQESYGYDALNRLTSVDYPSKRHVEYGYDAVGNRKWMVDSSKGGTRWATTATASSQYGSTLGPNQAIGAPNAGCGSQNGWWPWWSSSNPSQQWLLVGYARPERASAVRVAESYKGGFVSRIDLIEEGGTSHTVFSGGDRTACGGELKVSFPLTGYKVAQVRVYTQSNEPVGVDAVGLEALATDDYQYNGFNQLTGITSSDGSTTAFGYDNNGNQTSKTETPAGGTAQLTQYIYNQDNRLVGIALPSGISDAFEYDANGLRTKKTDSYGTTRYLLDGLSVIGQYGQDGTRQAWYTQSLARIDEVLNVVNNQGKFWYQSDALGSTYALAGDSGAVVARGGYDVFGAPVAISGSVGQPFGFTGREHDLDSAMTYHRDRYLQVAYGRWTQADRLGSAAIATDAVQTVTSQVPQHAWRFSAILGATLVNKLPVEAYGYVRSSPVGLTDRSGFAPDCSKHDWIGAPLVFGEVSLGPVAGILFAGIYTNLDSGRQVLVVSLLGEVGLFFETDKWLKRQPYSLAPGFEIGVGGGMEMDIARAEFNEEIFAERVYQIGPLIMVFSGHGESVFITNHLGLGAGVLIGGGWVNRVWDI